MVLVGGFEGGRGGGFFVVQTGFGSIFISWSSMSFFTFFDFDSKVTSRYVTELKIAPKR